MRVRDLFVTYVLIVIVAVIAGSAGAIEIVAGPYLQAPTEMSMTVMWMTDTNSTASVEYGIDGVLERKAFDTVDGQIAANTRIHSVTITGLTPGGSYDYRVVSTEIVKYEPYKVTYGETVNSEAFGFTTLDSTKDDCSFVVFNDVHDNVKNFKGRVEMSNAGPFEMVFLNGDIINDPKSEEQIVNVLLKPASETFAGDVPFILARGNHETRGAYSRKIRDYLATPSGEYYYAFQHGPVFIVAIDSGEDKEDTHWAYSGLNDFDSFRDEETEWLKGVVATKEFKEAKYRVVLTHIPLFGSGDAHGTLDCRKKWAGILNDAKIDLHISGHTHRAAVLEPVAGEHDYPIFIGGGPQDGRYTIIRVVADQEKLKVTMTKDGGEEIGAYEVKSKKKKGLLESIFGIFGN